MKTHAFMKKSSILIIYTGGTIGMKTDAETGALVPFDFSGIYDEFPSLKRLNVDIEVLTMSPVILYSPPCRRDRTRVRMPSSAC